jgi:hypothetical protein
MNVSVVSLAGLRDELYHVAESLRNATAVTAYLSAVESNRVLWERLRRLLEAGHPLGQDRVREDLLSKVFWVEGIHAQGLPLPDQAVEQLIVINLQTYVQLRTALEA